MTEQEWLTCANAGKLRKFIMDRGSSRKLRLFSCACVRSVWCHLKDQRSRDAVEIAERLADGATTREEIDKARIAASEATQGERTWATWAACSVLEYYYLEGLRCAHRETRRYLLRDIFGNPFRQLPPRPEAIAPLAEEIYAGKWELMPLLGEWLQEHGYWSEGEHCLDPKNQHVKGCWVVDWVTGRE